MKTLFSLLIVTSLWSSVKAQSYFPPLVGSNWDTLSPASLNWCPERIDSLYNFLEANDTRAFIVLKNGKIVLERYFGTHTQNTPWYWASAGKTLTAFMVGIAQQENFLEITDTTSTYLGQGWTNCTPLQEEKITIRHQLTMTSGLDDGVADPFCTLDTCLNYLADPGTRWAYHNGPYTLLDSVIEMATGSSLNNYTTIKLKNPTGMTGAFIPVDYNNVFYSTARSMARFGLLIENEGNWNGNQIMTDANYFYEMTHTSQSINEAYGYLWWLNGSNTYHLPGSQFTFPGSINPNAPADMICALGKNGQFIDVVPSQDLVLIRMGDFPSSALVPYLFNDQIWEYMNQLNCNGVGLAETTATNVELYPNPTEGALHIAAEQPILSTEFFTLSGTKLSNQAWETNKVTLSVEHFESGIYFVNVTLIDGTMKQLKFVVN